MYKQNVPDRIESPNDRIQATKTKVSEEGRCGVQFTPPQLLIDQPLSPLAPGDKQIQTLGFQSPCNVPHNPDWSLRQTLHFHVSLSPLPKCLLCRGRPMIPEQRPVLFRPQCKRNSKFLSEANDSLYHSKFLEHLSKAMQKVLILRNYLH